MNRFREALALALTSEDHNTALYRGVQEVLDETLSLGSRAYQLRPESPLLGALPELDSQAVLSVLLGLEERFGIAIADADITAEAFTTLGSLAELVARADADK